ncbi:MAG: bifunctional methylenetetrahydrofolate dehydrogenase/methenyltetrahydrofolate cyclohydrolase FolD [Betaproteobacteria bacterium]|nr:bifunctional methylenetetrahydrofolate dehydrogenase/methenyltetrahydrofolate cyclohydrolase FolD [Betaproteobacteria bacterium]
MAARIIDGNVIAHKVRADWRTKVDALRAHGTEPGLAVVIVGDNPASRVYVRHKTKACAETGIRSEVVEFPADASEAAVLERIARLNADPKVHGILVQLPLPAHIDTRKLLEAIDVRKDVDGFNLYNVGSLVAGETIFPPCTPYGVLCMLEYSNIPIAGQNVIVVGASNIVGKPMASMLMKRDATVAITHIKTRDLAQWTILADILVVAAGKPNLITGPMVRTGAVVIDVGINRLPDGRLVGDVDFDAVKEKASYITPVPGGVGPMTVTMLLVNTIKAAQRASGLDVSDLDTRDLAAA